MIRPTEIDRLKDLNSPQADALVDLCRPRVLVLAKAPYSETIGGGDSVDLLSYRFSDSLGASGLSRGDMIRGEVFGTFTNVATTNHEFYVQIGTKKIAQILYTEPDLAGSIVSWRARFVARIQGGEDQTINSPSKSSTSTIQAYLAIDVGDTGVSLYSVSQLLSVAHVTVTDPILDSAINLAVPLSLKLSTAMPLDSTLVIYGGAMEGL